MKIKRRNSNLKQSQENKRLCLKQQWRKVHVEAEADVEIEEAKIKLKLTQAKLHADQKLSDFHAFIYDDPKELSHDNT